MQASAMLLTACHHFVWHANCC